MVHWSVFEGFNEASWTRRIAPEDSGWYVKGREAAVIVSLPTSSI